jgi:hypothetical protein
MKFEYIEAITENICSWCGNIYDLLYVVNIDDTETRTLCENCLNNLLEFLKKHGIEVEEEKKNE